MAVLFRVLVAAGVLALLFYKIPAGAVWDAMDRFRALLEEGHLERWSADRARVT